MDGWRKMAKEMEPRRWADLDHAGPDIDPAVLLAAIMAQNSGPTNVVSGPEWASQLQPPAIPGTFQAKYAKAGLPARWFAWFILWVTWDWKRGAFVLLVLALIAAILITR